MPLFLQFFKDRKSGHFFFSLGLILYGLMLAASMPAVLENKEMFEKLLSAYPEKVLTFLAGSGIDFSTLLTKEGYLTMEFFALWFPIILFAYIISYTVSVISKDYESGTIEPLLAQPVTRTRIIVERFLAVTIGLFSLSFITVFSLWILLKLYDQALAFTGLLAVGIHAFCFVLVFGAINLFFTSVFLEKGKALGISIGIFVLMHVANALSDSVEFLDKIKFLSLFNYYKIYQALLLDPFPLKETLLFVGIVVVLFVSSIFIFKGKDIAVS